MSYLVRSHVSTPKPRAWTVNRQQESQERSETSTIVTRRVDIQWMSSDGEIQYKSAVAPAMPTFEEAFAAVAQGTLVQTENGYTAVEDLEAGMMIATADGSSQPLMWIGSMTIFPQASSMGLQDTSMFRVTDGGFGHDHTTPDLMLGPAARVLPGLYATNSTSNLMPIEELADGVSVIKLRPMAPIRVFHMCLGTHRLIRANGVLLETFHPGPNAKLHMSRELFGHYLSLFPHVRSESDFGPLNHKR